MKKLCALTALLFSVHVFADSSASINSRLEVTPKYKESIIQVEGHWTKISDPSVKSYFNDGYYDPYWKYPKSGFYLNIDAIKEGALSYTLNDCNDLNQINNDKKTAYFIMDWLDTQYTCRTSS